MPGYHSGKGTNLTRTTAANSCTLPATPRQAQQQLGGGILRHRATKKRSGGAAIIYTRRPTRWDTFRLIFRHFNTLLLLYSLLKHIFLWG